MHAVWWVFWLAVVVAVLVLLGPASRSGREPRMTPLERLQRRYADGEISTEEYEERKKTLERDRATR
jgi:putative membrane protein